MNRVIETAELDYFWRVSRLFRTEHVRNQEIRRRINSGYSSEDRKETIRLLWYDYDMRRANER